jgi:hypothetical protein
MNTIVHRRGLSKAIFLERDVGRRPTDAIELAFAFVKKAWIGIIAPTACAYAET